MQPANISTSLNVLNRRFNDKPGPGNDKPFIYFNQIKGHLYMIGKSTEVNIGEQIAPLLNLIDDHFLCNDRLACLLDLDDINASTCKFLFKLFRKLQFYKEKKTISVTWRIADETSDLLDIALEFIQIYRVKINIQYNTHNRLRSAA